jgi:hypothetical protein
MAKIPPDLHFICNTDRLTFKRFKGDFNEILERMRALYSLANSVDQAQKIDSSVLVDLRCEVEWNGWYDKLEAVKEKIETEFTTFPIIKCINYAS